MREALEGASRLQRDLGDRGQEGSVGSIGRLGEVHRGGMGGGKAESTRWIRGVGRVRRGVAGVQKSLA